MNKVTMWVFENDGSVGKSEMTVVDINSANVWKLKCVNGEKSLMYVNSDQFDMPTATGNGYYVMQLGDDFEAAKEAVLKLIAEKLDESFTRTIRLVEKHKVIRKCTETA